MWLPGFFPNTNGCHAAKDKTMLRLNEGRVVKRPADIDRARRECSAHRRMRMASVSHTWGTEPHERAGTLPCDRVVPCPDDTLYRGITIEAQPSVVFRWLCQMRVAPYSYDWIDNLGRQSPRRLIPGLDELALGQEVMRDFELVDFAQDQHLTVRVKATSLIRRICGDTAASYCVIPEGTGKCRLLVKAVVCYPRGGRGWLLRRLLPWGDLIMMRRQLLNFKELAERDGYSAAARRHTQERNRGDHGRFA